MQRIAFYRLPLLARIACALALLNSWVLIAEFVIDRYGFDDRLPFYRFGDVCVWDFAVLAIVLTLVAILSRQPTVVGHDGGVNAAHTDAL